MIITRDYLGPEKNIEKCMSDEVIDVICGFDNPRRYGSDTRWKMACY